MGISWTPLDTSTFESLRSSNATIPIPKECQLEFLDRMTGAVGMWAVGYADLHAVTSDGTTIRNVRGHFDVLRRDVTPDVVKSYRYLLAQQEDGSTWFVGPFKGLDYGHWLNDLPEWSR